MATFKRAAFLFCVIFIAIWYAIFTKEIFAHQPEDMVVAYDEKNKVVSIGVIHLTEKGDKHFLKEIKVKLNGKKIITQVFSRQADSKVQTVKYVIAEVVDKDKLEIAATCSNGDSLKRTFNVE